MLFGAFFFDKEFRRYAFWQFLLSNLFVRFLLRRGLEII